MSFGTTPPGQEPKWLRDWRCPHCGFPARRYSYTSPESDEDDHGVTEFECQMGHVRQISGIYSAWPV